MGFSNWAFDDPRSPVRVFQSKWADRVRLLDRLPVAFNYDGKSGVQPRQLLLISVHGLDEDGRAALLRDYLELVQTRAISLLISHQKVPHIYLRVGDQAIDYHFDTIATRHIRGEPYRLARRFVLDVLLQVSAVELDRLKIYVANAQRDIRAVLGEPPKLIDGDEERPQLTVRSVQTEGRLDANRLLDPQERHNCFTWIMTAPVGEHGEAIHTFFPLSESDIKGEVHSWTTAFSTFILARPDDGRCSCLVLQTGKELQAELELLRDPKYLASTILLDPDA